MSASPQTPRGNLARLLTLLLVDLLLLAALAATIWFDNAANRGITFRPDPYPIPYTDGPLLGVNAFNLHLEPDPAVVTRTLALARDMGAGYVRMQVPWEDLEIHGRGDFSDSRNDLDGDGQKDTISAWAKYDRIVDTAVALDLELIMRLERPPLWARSELAATPFFAEGLLRDGNSTGPPDNFADYGNFVRAIVGRYQGKVRFYQIWNEPNLKNEWNWQEPKPEDFAELLRVGATAARAADPQAVILFPSLAPTDGLDPSAPMTELEYLDRVYRSGGADYFDIMSGQAYGLGQPPDEHRYVFLRGQGNWVWSRPIDTRNDVSRIVLLREVMERNGDAATPVWIGEFGWNSAPETIAPERRLTWGQPVSEETKAAYLVGHIERARREWPWVGVMNVWMLRYGGFAEADPGDPTPYFALVSRDWQPQPAYQRLMDYTSGPAVAGVGAHSWAHPAVEPLAGGGWRIRFSGTKLTLVGGLAGGIEPVIDGQPTSLSRDGLDGRQALSTGQLADGEHTLELRGGPAPEWFIVERAQPLAWLWPGAIFALLAALAVSGAATMRGILASMDDLLAWRARSAERFAILRADSLIQVGMLLGLLIFYRLSPRLLPSLLGLALFGGLALLRPGLALRFVPLTVPLFFMPKALWDAQLGIRDEGLRIPLHEVVLLVTAAATAAQGGWGWVRQDERRKTKDESRAAALMTGGQVDDGARAFVLRLSSFVPAGARAFVLRLSSFVPAAARAFVLRLPSFVPVFLFLIAGTIGVLVAGERGPALREWRWLIVEPLIFCGLVLYWEGGGQGDRGTRGKALVIAFLLGGAFAGLVGILQFLGLNLVPLIGQKVGFSDDQILVEGVRRVNSLYGHPNNLGLYMGRIWPLAVALLVAGWRGPTVDRRAVLFYALCALLAFGGLLVSFSRGAWLGALLAGLVLLLRLGPPGLLRSRRLWLGLGALVAALAIGLAVALGLGIERLNPLGESSGARLLTWASALGMLADHPLLGIGLDQFVQRYPQYIDPSLLGTNEVNTAHPHTLLLDIPLRMGLLGLVAFAWLVGQLLRGAARGRGPLMAGVLAASAAALAHGLVDSYYFWPDLAFAFWLFVALVWAEGAASADKAD